MVAGFNGICWGNFQNSRKFGVQMSEAILKDDEHIFRLQIPAVIVAGEDEWGIPEPKNGIILVTVTGKGPLPNTCIYVCNIM